MTTTTTTSTPMIEWNPSLGWVFLPTGVAFRDLLQAATMAQRWVEFEEVEHWAHASHGRQVSPLGTEVRHLPFTMVHVAALGEPVVDFETPTGDPAFGFHLLDELASDGWVPVRKIEDGS